jgi:ATP-dependent DNA helicase RecQ
MTRAFTPPDGQIKSVKVAVIMARSRKKGDAESLKTDSWEVVIPEISFIPH